MRGQALVRAARTEAIGFVAMVGLHQVAGLTALEAELLKQSPLCESRIQAIVDTATMAIVGEISRMQWQ